MLHDILTIIQKDLKEILSTRGNRRTGLISLAIMVALIGIFMPLQSGRAWFTEPIVPLVWSWFPVFLMISMITDAIAGERERNTLETLLASRLSDRAILFGKIGGAVVYGWTISVLGNLVAAITINVSDPQGGIQFYPFGLFIVLLLLPLVIGILMSSLGVLVSLNAPTARAAYQKLSLVMLGVWFIPMFVLNVIPEKIQIQINQFISSINLVQVAILGIGIVIALDLFVITLAQKKFKRTKLILD